MTATFFLAGFEQSILKERRKKAGIRSREMGVEADQTKNPFTAIVLPIGAISVDNFASEVAAPLIK